MRVFEIHISLVPQVPMFVVPESGISHFSRPHVFLWFLSPGSQLAVGEESRGWDEFRTHPFCDSHCVDVTLQVIPTSGFGILF